MSPTRVFVVSPTRAVLDAFVLALVRAHLDVVAVQREVAGLASAVDESGADAVVVHACALRCAQDLRAARQLPTPLFIFGELKNARSLKDAGLAPCYVGQEAGLKELLNRVARASRGSAADGGGRPGRRRPRTAIGSLTPREKEVATGLTHGLSNKEIARELGITVSTTKAHVHSVLTKLGLENRGKVAYHLLESSGAAWIDRSRSPDRGERRREAQYCGRAAEPPPVPRGRP